MPDFIPAQVILDFTHEDLAEHLLAFLIRLEDSQSRLTIHNFRYDRMKEYGRDDVAKPLLEAWSVLEREGFITREQDNYYFVTRRGRAAAGANSFQSFRIASLLPKDILHHKLLPNVWGAFVRGQYDTAVFEACKEVEISVRDAAGLPESLLGTDLMRTAFHPENGTLTDKTRHKAERHALSDLFAGTIGSYKNPNSHRRVKISPRESVEIVVLASHLLAIVDSRTENVSDDRTQA